MIDGAHVMIFSRDADADRAFFKTVVGLRSVDAGGGWPVFELPPAEVAVHPDESGDRHELYLMCTDLEAAMTRLEESGIHIESPPRDTPWGRVTTIQMPGGGKLGLYQPKHQRAAAALDP